MFRKMTLALVAVASLSAALAPTIASANGMGGHNGGKMGGPYGGIYPKGNWGNNGGYWHGGCRHSRFFGGPSFYVGGNDGCYQKQLVEAFSGPRVRLVNVCS
ncbi:MAG: sulfur globule protein precursor [Xanthobacteraceae bacterium]|nr:sulfur globule protein precursor [Xanthobacteraceae bacterium]